MIYAIDFDGTIVTHEFPKIGRPVPNAFETMRKMLERGDKLILFTMRSGEYLQEAVDYCNGQGIEFWGINENPEQKLWTSSPKVYAHFYIDDAALGAPLTSSDGERPYLNWYAASSIIFSNKETVQNVIIQQEAQP